jgi:hypothetical protein
MQGTYPSKHATYAATDLVDTHRNAKNLIKEMWGACHANKQVHFEDSNSVV